MFIDTVAELFDCFNTIPNAIVYFDNRENIQDVEYFNHKIEDVNQKFLAFLGEYGNRELVDFNFDGIEETMHIEFS